MYQIICARCSKDLPIVYSDKVMVGMEAMRIDYYGGVECSKCGNLECSVCKGGASKFYDPCSWCGSDVKPIGVGEGGINLPRAARR